MHKAGKAGMLAAALLVTAASTARADGTFLSGNYCGGNNFSTCATVTASNVGNVVTLTVTNTSGSPTSFFTAMGLGNIGDVTVTNFSTSLPARFELGTSGLSGAGIIDLEVGANAKSPGPTNGLRDGETVTFTFTLGGEYDFSDAQFALHDQGGNIEGCETSTKLVVTDGQPNTALCNTTAVPEPVTMSLLATGLAGMGGMGAMRRRKKV